MTHIKEKVAEFVLQELSERETAEMTAHLAQCPSCREEVEQFQSTVWKLKASPDVEPPRRILFEFERPRAAAWFWRWAGPMAASAAVALAVVTLAPRPQPVTQVVERQVPQNQPAAAPAVVAQPVDYQKILDELRTSDRVWLENELRKRDAARAREVQRLQAAVDLLDFKQTQIKFDTLENQANVQYLAARTEPRE